MKDLLHFLSLFSNVKTAMVPEISEIYITVHETMKLEIREAPRRVWQWVRCHFEDK
tara:strand:- start:813 stop:980 length:168 start_codon:yes stop_codon:yes gene_type:complete